MGKTGKRDLREGVVRVFFEALSYSLYFSFFFLSQIFLFFVRLQSTAYSFTNVFIFISFSFLSSNPLAGATGQGSN